MIQVLSRVEPYLTSKSTVEKVCYLENLLDIGESFASDIHREENSRKKLLGSLQLKVVFVILCRLLQLLESSLSSEDGDFSEHLLDPTLGTVEERGVTLEKFHTLRRRFLMLQETPLLGTVSFVPLAEETVVRSVVKSFPVNTDTGKARSDVYKNYLSFLQLPETAEEYNLQALKKAEIEDRKLLRKRRGVKASEGEVTHHIKERNEVLTAELLSLTEKLKSGSEEVYEALKRDQERLEKLADVVDNNLSQTGKQLRLTEQFGNQTRKNKWHVWIILSLLPLLWILVYLTIRFH
ncbi:hypothetical protein Gasu2_05150 [Galdieria sulphuraria]|uniref:Vesicle transport protein USE1 n=1 Tax=Galdieria sulphuraria TaxID=130081 RepID=M2W985_GALSU|nr:uncharacterized protein Gasu_05110 [Galdieria sulphuraria]EME32426.1 hypothetical protein Gasu_05110 [Galdieria sulphuraria]GJD06080.1 hypothetical protein Gasu2_05150 [Galdieria sulphuraria]|eukprot:XP_005708946.1 hypothetical protein Gasu_05110 [Galdieria sulphuraria]